MLTSILIDSIRYASSFSIILPLVLGLLFFTRLQPPFRLLTIYLLVGAITQLLATFIRTYYTTVPNKYNLFLYHIFIIVEFCLLALIYKHKFEEGKSASVKLFYGLIVLFTIVSIANTIVVMKPFSSLTEFIWNFRYIAKFNNYAQLLEDFILMILAFIYLYKLLRELKVENLEKEAFFWFNVGVLIYFSSKFTLDILNNFLLSYSKDFRFMAWIVHAITNILLHLFFTVALWLNSRKQMS